MIVSAIAAVSQNRVIGKNNDLPWHLPDDMKFFMETTKGHHVIMGRKNYESLPKKFRPLPHRTNIVITRQRNLEIPECIVVHSLEEALEIAQKQNEKEAMIIGGSEIFKLGLPYTHRLYLTEIQAQVEGDVYFPEFDKNEWKETKRSHHSNDERHAYSFDFVTYERVNSAKELNV